MALISDGFAVVDSTGVWGIGASAEEAWADFALTLFDENIELIDDAADVTDFRGSWAKKSSFRLGAATQSLIDLVRYSGGQCGWGEIAGTLCTIDECDAAFSK